MMRWIAIGGIFAALLLGACQEREQAQAPAGQEQKAVGQTGQQQDRTAAAQGQQPDQQSAQSQQAQEQETAAAKGQQQQDQQTAQGQQQDQQATTGQAGQEQAAAPAGQSQEKSEFFGQSPTFANAPETITLQATNGNVTLPHKMHAEMMDCKTCHGDGTPGKIEGFGKDKAHPLCQGCHKEKGAGPTKCQECHKK